jgi:hypothetical protein
MSRLRAGDWVEVRSKEEILRTLDKQGRLDGMPFMPQMFQYCGMRFKVFKRAHKTCDTIAFNWDSPGRSLADGIHLNLRCDGQTYGGCQAACLIFWKEQWLKPVDGATGPAVSAMPADATHYNEPAGNGRCTEEDVRKAVRAPSLKPGDEAVYSCQATRLLEFTKPLPWWDFRQYLEDYTSGNASLWRIVRGTIYICYFYPTLSFSRRFGGPARWIYDRFQSLWGGLPFPRHWGQLPAGQPAPVATLNLQPGELVRVKSYDEILKTIEHKTNRNRGMTFDGEMMPYCGGIYRVRGRIEKFIDEKTGKIKTMKTPAVILDDVYCRSRYSYHRMYCPRSIFSWWREVWLERVSEGNPERVTASSPERVPVGKPERVAEDIQR